MPRKCQLSVAIITMNESDCLPDCVDSVAFADEIVVVDSGSTDGTAAMARKLGCNLIQHPFSGFGRQKQVAVDHCRNEWVLILDADERLTAEGAEILTAALTSDCRDTAAFLLQRKNFLHGRWIRHSGWWPDPLVRLVKPAEGRFSPDMVHECWLTDGKVSPLACVIEHHSFRNYDEMIRKLQHYSTLGARQMASAGEKTSVISPLTHGIWTFMQTYFLKLGVLDGFDGFMIAAMDAGGSFMKYAKLIESRSFGNSI